MKSEQDSKGQFIGTTNGLSYTINDDKAAQLHDYWQETDINKFVQQVFADKILWSTDLNQLPGFADAVIKNIEDIKDSRIKKLIQSSNLKFSLL